MTLGRVIKLRRKKCGFRGCDERGTYTPVLVFPMITVEVDRVKPNVLGKAPLEMELEIEVCERHRRNPKTAFISDQGFGYMLKLLARHGFTEAVSKSDIELWFLTEDGMRLPWSVDERTPA